MHPAISPTPARPAGLLAKKAKEFESVCTIEKGGKSVNITKLMALMGLGVKQGDTVTVTCEGADEDKASEALKAFFEETLLIIYATNLLFSRISF